MARTLGAESMCADFLKKIFDIAITLKLNQFANTALPTVKLLRQSCARQRPHQLNIPIPWSRGIRRPVHPRWHNDGHKPLPRSHNNGFCTADETVQAAWRPAAQKSGS